MNVGAVTAGPAPGSTIRLIEDFLGGGANASGGGGANGNLNWKGNSVGAPSGQSFSNLAAVYPNLGLLNIVTGTAGAGTGLTLSLAGSSDVGPFGDLGSNVPWEAYWIFRLNSSAATRFRLGFLSAYTVVQPGSGIWLRYDTASGFADAAFKFECRAGSVSTVSGTTATYDANFHKLRIRSTTAGTVIFNFDGGADITISSNVPTTQLAPGAIMVSDSTGSKNCDLDYFSFYMTGVAR